MSPKHRPLTCKEVKCILRNLGFTPEKRSSTSHEKWTKTADGKRRIVTVDCPKEPFGNDLIRYMALQAGVTRDQFYSAL